MKCLIVTLGAILAISQVALAATDTPGSIPEELTKAAAQVLSIMDKQGQTQIDVGQIIPVGDQASGGQGLRLEFIDALHRARKGVVNQAAKLAVNGRFKLVDDPQDAQATENKLLVERVTLEIIGKRPLDFEQSITFFIKRLRDIATLEGVTLSLDQENPTVRGDHARLRRVLDDSKSHPPHIDGSKISSGSKSPYALEFRVLNPRGDAAHRLQAKIDELGFASVDIEENQLYELKFYNTSQAEVAISVKIDGIDVFAFTDSKERNADTGKPLYTHFIVSAGGQTTVKGWFKHADQGSDDNVQRFLVTEYGKGAASKQPIKAQGSIGVVTVEISNVASENERGGAETGFGPPAKVHFIPVERSIKPPHDFISVRYLR